ncbi:MAG: DUF4846 domain-containing protein [Candidatus Weimeria sp.]
MRMKNERIQMRRILTAMLLTGVMLLSSCGSISSKPGRTSGNSTGSSEKAVTSSSSESGKNDKKNNFINPDGKTLETRINTPEGYTRTKEAEGSLGEFLRNYKMKKDGSPILLYDGSVKNDNGRHAAVFKLPLENVDLQQCADSIMRVYAEYYRSIGKDDRIAFHFTNGFLASYSKWKQGYRISVNGNRVSWTKSAQADDSDETFIKYLHIVFNYAGTMSMDTESKKIDLKDIRIGDIFLRAGSPGHVMMVVDTCENADGKKAFLLAQGFTPAQEFHVLKNHGDDPWYYEDDVDYSKNKDQYSIGTMILKRPEY